MCWLKTEYISVRSSSQEQGMILLDCVILLILVMVFVRLGIYVHDLGMADLSTLSTARVAVWHGQYADITQLAARQVNSQPFLGRFTSCNPNRLSPPIDFSRNSQIDISTPEWNWSDLAQRIPFPLVPKLNKLTDSSWDNSLLVQRELELIRPDSCEISLGLGIVEFKQNSSPQEKRQFTPLQDSDSTIIIHGMIMVMPRIFYP